MSSAAAEAAHHGAFTIVWHHGSPQTGAPLAPLVTAASDRGIRLVVSILDGCPLATDWLVAAAAGADR